jgi:hypothetical protein
MQFFGGYSSVVDHVVEFFLLDRLSARSCDEQCHDSCSIMTDTWGKTSPKLNDFLKSLLYTLISL